MARKDETPEIVDEEKQKPVIFQSTDRGCTQLFDNEGKLLHFRRQDNNLVRSAGGSLIRTNQSDDWICVTDEPEIIARARKHPKYGKEFWEVDRIPTKHSASIAKAFGHAFPEQPDTVKQAVRFGELKAKLFKIDGEQVKNANPDELAEYETLKKQLGV